jgi:hypothetical protein
MVTEVLVWALIVTNNGPETVNVYDKELICRQDMREAHRALPEAKLKCVPRHSMQRPGWQNSGRAP